MQRKLNIRSLVFKMAALLPSDPREAKMAIALLTDMNQRLDNQIEAIDSNGDATLEGGEVRPSRGHPLRTV